jgi:hypothetical protein
LAFGLFAVGIGGFYLVLGSFGEVVAATGGALLATGARALLAAGLGLLVVGFPTRLQRRELPHLAIALTAGLVSTILYRWFATPPPLVWYYEAAAVPSDTFAAAALLLFPLRVRRLGQPDAAGARSMGIFAVGLALLVAGNAAFVVDAAQARPLEQAGIVLTLSLLIASVVLWAWAARGPHARMARNVALASAAIYTLGALAGSVNADLAYPLGRLLGALVLGYAVLRGLLEGLDLKVRFAISKSTLAAVFIAVFFVASEAAQQFLGAALQNEYVGILAAGMLVFAIAPLSRVADRIAETAVPLGHGTGTIRLKAPEAAYVAALRAAARDGVFSRREERHLAEAAEHLGIGPKRALELREHVEREAP